MKHHATAYQESGGWGWECSCGKRSGTLFGYPSEAQAKSRLARHLRAVSQRSEGN